MPNPLVLDLLPLRGGSLAAAAPAAAAAAATSVAAAGVRWHSNQPENVVYR